MSSKNTRELHGDAKERVKDLKRVCLTRNAWELEGLQLHAYFILVRTIL